MSFFNLPFEIVLDIVSKLPIRRQHLLVNRLFSETLRPKLTKTVKTIQRWYRHHRLCTPPPDFIPLTHWTKIRYFVAKFPTKVLDIICCSLMFSGISAKDSNDSIGRLALLIGGSHEDAIEASGKAALDTAIAMGESPLRIVSIVSEAILKASRMRIGIGATGNVASRFRVYCLNNLTHADLEFLFRKKDLWNFLKNGDFISSFTRHSYTRGETLAYSFGINFNAELEHIMWW